MAVGLVSSSNPIVWLGQQFLGWVDSKVNDQLVRTGQRIMQRAKQLAPVRTGALRDSIDYTITRTGRARTLHIEVGMYYGIFQEFGTRNIRPHPFVRPALLEASRIWGAGISMDFAASGSAPWQGMYYMQHRRQARYVVPSSLQPRPLTRAQHLHVQRHLVPSAQMLHHGNVRRASLVVRRNP